MSLLSWPVTTRAQELTFAGTKFYRASQTPQRLAENYYREGETRNAWTQQLFVNVTPTPEDPQKIAQDLLAAARQQAPGSDPTIVQSGTDTWVSFTYRSLEGIGQVTIVQRIFRDPAGRVRTYALAQRPSNGTKPAPVLTPQQAMAALRMLPADLPRPGS